MTRYSTEKEKEMLILFFLHVLPCLAASFFLEVV